MQTHSHTDMLRYYYSKLTSIQKKAFDIIISCIQNYNNIIRLNSCNISLDEIFKLIEIIDRDYPELFYIDIKRHPVEIMKYRNTIEIRIGFIYNVATISKYVYRFSSIRDSLINHISSMSSYKLKLDCIYDSISKSVVYNYGAITPMDYTISGTFINHTGICEGYAKLLKYFCDAVGIQCFVISGSGIDNVKNNIENHAWNIVTLDGIHYHHVDVTWDSVRKQNNLNNKYYLKSDMFMMKDHYWSNEDLPSCVDYKK